MLARLLRLVVLTWLLLAAIVAAAVWQWGGTLAAAGALVAVAGFQSVFLAVEFALAQSARGNDPSPRPTLRQLLVAWWRETVSAIVVFGWRQPFRSSAEPDHLPLDASGRRGVLLVHGFVCNRGLWGPRLRQLRASNTPFVAVNLEPVFGAIEQTASVIEAAVRRLEAATGIAPIAVAHSMGGLALRAWWAGDGHSQRLYHAITIATPHRGTWLARFAMSANGFQMQQESRWLRDLEAREPPHLGSRFSCFYSHCDNIVFPPSTATLPGAENHHVPAHAHVHLVSHDGWWNVLQRKLRG